MRQLRVMIALATAALLAGCSSTSDTQQRHSSSPVPASQHPSTSTTPFRSSHHVTGSGRCPVTRTWQTAAHARLAAAFGARHLLGPGPVYPGVYTPQRRWRRETVVEMNKNPSGIPHPTGWLVAKVLWMNSRDYRGPVWIRGREVGGTGRMKFSQGGAVSSMLHFHVGGGLPSESFVPRPGCYAWQIRGRGFNVVLVFRAVCVFDGDRRCE